MAASGRYWPHTPLTRLAKWLSGDHSGCARGRAYGGQVRQEMAKEARPFAPSINSLARRRRPSRPATLHTKPAMGIERRPSTAITMSDTERWEERAPPICAGCCSMLNCKTHIQIQAFCYRMAMSLPDLGLPSRALTRPPATTDRYRSRPDSE